MERATRPLLVYVQATLDTCVAFCAFFLSAWLINNVLRPQLTWLTEFNYAYHYWTSVVVVLLLLLFVRILRLEDPNRAHTSRELATRIPLAVILTIAFFALALFTMRHFMTRPFLFVLMIVLLVMLTAKEFLFRLVLRQLNAGGHGMRNVVIYGAGPQAAEMVGLVNSNPRWGMQVIGLIYDGPDNPGHPPELYGVRVLGDTTTGAGVLEQWPVDDLIIASRDIPEAQLRRLIQSCEEIGVSAKLSLGYFGTSIARHYLEAYDSALLLAFSTVPQSSLSLYAKEVFDWLAALATLLVLGPFVMLPIAIAIRLTSRKGEPVLFRQRRVGLNGRKFRFYKFRTMRTDAEMLKNHVRHLNEMDGPVFKIKNDPRVTRLGHVLRRFSLDELPQLYNVLKGDMSFVGPRPPLPEEVENYDRWQRRRLSMKPGLTCIWQVSGRNRVGFHEWMRMDLKYIDNWSLWLDAKILARTVWVVLTGQGM